MSNAWLPPAHPWSWRLWAGGLAGLLALALAATGAPPAHAPDTSPLDEPLRLLAEARKRYAEVKDYTCLMIKREQVNDSLQPENVIKMKVRTEPFSVYLRWQEPKNLVGQEACYVAGRNDGKLRVKGAGARGLFGFVSLDPDDPRIKAASRHSITEAGIGNLIRRFGAAWEAERQLGLTQVRLADYDYNKRRCVRVETIHPRKAEGKFLFFRTVVYFDKETRLPIRVECYGWPQDPDDTRGPLAEVCSYAHLKLNVGLEDEVFDH
jgi:hypothetical protein